MPPPAAKTPGPAGRDRLLETARRLFTGRGAANVGINDVTAQAGVARMTLYNNFPSKDALIAAVYQGMADDELDGLRRLDAGIAGGEEAAILALFDHVGRGAGEAEYRGCPLIHAGLQAAEARGPVHAIARRYKRALREHVRGLLDARRADRDGLADQIVLLLDGAVTEACLGGVDAPIAAGKRAASALLRAGEPGWPGG